MAIVSPGACIDQVPRMDFLVLWYTMPGNNVGSEKSAQISTDNWGLPRAVLPGIALDWQSIPCCASDLC